MIYRILKPVGKSSRFMIVLPIILNLACATETFQPKYEEITICIEIAPVPASVKSETNSQLTIDPKRFRVVAFYNGSGDQYWVRSNAQGLVKLTIHPRPFSHRVALCVYSGNAAARANVDVTTNLPEYRVKLNQEDFNFFTTSAPELVEKNWEKYGKDSPE